MTKLYAVGIGYNPEVYFETKEEAMAYARNFWNRLTRDEKASDEPIVYVYKFNSTEASEEWQSGESDKCLSELADTLYTEADFRKEDEKEEKEA